MWFLPNDELWLQRILFLFWNDIWNLKKTKCLISFWNYSVFYSVFFLLKQESFIISDTKSNFQTSRQINTITEGNNSWMQPKLFSHKSLCVILLLHLSASPLNPPLYYYSDTLQEIQQKWGEGRKVNMVMHLRPLSWSFSPHRSDSFVSVVLYCLLKQL